MAGGKWSIFHEGGIRMNTTFKNFLIEAKEFSLLTEALEKKWSLKVTALKIKEPKLREQALKLAEKLKNLAVAKSVKNRHDDFLIDIGYKN